MLSQTQSEVWSENGRELLSHPFLNFCARRRVAISLLGFLSLICFNLVLRRTIPANPFDWSQGYVALALLLIAFGLFVRSWSAGTLNKSREVTQQGPYALTRNPLYIGSFSMMFGFCILMHDIAALLFVAGPMAFLYSLQISFEEKRLAHLFPQAWPAYENRVARLIPHAWSSEALSGWTGFEWLRNREYKAVSACIVGIFALYVWHYVGPSVWQ